LVWVLSAPALLFVPGKWQAIDYKY